MPFLPFSILGIWIRSLLAVAIIAGGFFCLRLWYEDSLVPEGAPVVPEANVSLDEKRSRAPDRIESSVPVQAQVEHSRRVFQFDPGWNRATAYLASAIGLLAWAFLGRWIGQGLRTAWSLVGQTSNRVSVSMDDEPRDERTGEKHRIPRPDGSELQVECYGPSGGPTVILTHGWGATSTEWYYLKKHLADRFRLIVWDLPGLGLSRKPDNNDYRLEKMAADLEAVLTFAGNQPAVLVGHSIGGMILLTFCRVFPEAIGQHVAGLVLAHTTYKNPVRTARMGSLYTLLEKPVIIPLTYLTIALWPLVWLMDIMSYWNGSAHRSTRRSSFAGTETPGQLDFVASYVTTARPDIMARGMLGMMAYDATATLPSINVPVLTVVGDRDTMTVPEAGQFITQTVPMGEIVSLVPARHMGLLEHHQLFNKVVAKFVDSRRTASVAG